jgi:hypothetical protein
MPLYLSFYFAGILLVSFYKNKYFAIISNKMTFFIFCVILICFAGFRYGIASDYWSYRNIFYRTNEYVRIEGGFKYLIRIYKNIFSNSYNGFVFFIAFLSIFLKYLYFKKLRHPFLAIIIYISLFYFILEYNGIRQGLAASFVLIAFFFWIRRKNAVIYFIMIGIASSIHISSILFFPLFFLFIKKISFKKSTIIVFLIAALCIRYFLIEKFLSIAASLSEGTAIAQLAQLSNYLFINKFSILIPGFIRRIVVIILFILITDKKRISNRYFYLYLIGTFFYILFMGNDIFAYRMSLVFDVFMIPLFADITIKRTYKNIGIIFSLLIVLFVLYWTTINAKGYVVPYQTYIFG